MLLISMNNLVIKLFVMCILRPQLVVHVPLEQPSFHMYVNDITFSIQNCWKVRLILPYILFTVAIEFLFLGQPKPNLLTSLYT